MGLVVVLVPELQKWCCVYDWSYLQPLYAPVSTKVSVAQLGYHTLARQCESVVKGDDASQCENGKFDPLPRPNPLTDRHKKVAHVIRSWISTHKQNLVTISQWVSFPACAKLRMNDVYSASFLSRFFQRPAAQAPNRFSLVTRQTTRFRARMCLFGVRRPKN